MAFIITIIAFFGVVIINVFTYVGIDLSSTFPIFNVSLLLIFLMTMILFIKEARRSGSFRRSVNILDAYNNLTKYEQWLVSAGGIYVAICFFINMFYISDGGTGVYEGQYAILDKGTFVRFITEEMFNK